MGEFIDIPLGYAWHCTHPEHNPPTHIAIPEGKMYRHSCPNCGNFSYVMTAAWHANYITV